MHWDKKGGLIGTIPAIVLVSLVFFFALGIFNYVFAEVNDNISEQACRFTNALRIGTSISVVGGDVRVAPRGCKTIDKTVPDEEHVNNVLVPPGREKEENAKKYATIQHVSDLAARCWWMWLEGISYTDKNGHEQKDVLDPSLLSTNNQCCICYVFELDPKKSVPFSTKDLVDYMGSTFHKIRDTSDQCSSLGGICKQKCSDVYTNDPAPVRYTEEVQGNCDQQRAGTKCCVVDKSYECENRGGKCSSDGIFKNPFNGWSCKGGGYCYLADANYFTYTRYIQEYNGRGRFQPDVGSGFQANTKYAVVFHENTDPAFFNINVYDLATKLWEPDKKQIDGIEILPLDRISKTCAVDWGVAEP